MKYLFKIFFICVPIIVSGQTKMEDKEPFIKSSLLLGIHYYKNAAVEIGISTSIKNGSAIGMRMGGEGIIYTFNHSLSTEIYFYNRFILAPKYSCWFSHSKIPFIDFGISGLYLSNFENNDWSLRPEIGLYLRKPGTNPRLNFKLKQGERPTIRRLKLVYGYNLFRNNFFSLPRHLISLIFFVEGNYDHRHKLK